MACQRHMYILNTSVFRDIYNVNKKPVGANVSDIAVNSKPNHESEYIFNIYSRNLGTEQSKSKEYEILSVNTARVARILTTNQP